MINDLWYKNAVIYCLSVGTYMDSNGDGVGDFAGLMRRLDYLQAGRHRDLAHAVSDLARAATTATTSPNYYEVDPRYGTLGDFVEFTHAAKQRGIRVIIDLVVNHTSDRASVVPGGAARSALEVSRLVRLVEERSRRTPNKGMVFPGRAEVHLDATTRWRAPGTSTASTNFSPT